MTDFLIFLQQFSSPVLDKIFLLISALTGEFSYIIILGIIYWCINKDKAFYIGTFLYLSIALNSLLKNLFHIPRPYTYSEVKQIDTSTGYGYSFPSGHAQLSTTFGGMFSVVFRKKWLYILSVILVVMTGFSRMYLGVHTPADILCGIAIGLILTLIGSKLKDTSNKKLLGIATLLLMLGVTLVYNSEDNLKLLFFGAGFFPGNLIEDKYIGYKIPKSKKIRILGALIGFATVIVTYIIFKLLNLNYIKYLVIGLDMAILIPYIIKKMNKKGQ